VATDPSGNVFVAGYTEGALTGDNLGGQDAFVVKLAEGGSEQWRRQFGGSDTDFVQGLTTDSSGNVLLVGQTRSNIGDSHKGSGDAFVVKYSAAGEVLWKKQLGTNTVEQFYDAATDSAGNVYAAGVTAGVIGEKNLGSFDGLLVKFDPNGEVLWKKQFGSNGTDIAWDVAAENNGFVYVTGSSSGAVAEANLGSNDGFLVKFDSGGNELWKKQIGSIKFDEAYDLATDPSGNVFVTGITEGDLFDTQKGVFDAFVVRYR
jgi:ribosomal protein L14